MPFQRPTAHTFTKTRAVKIIENHAGKAFIKVQHQVVVQQHVPVPPDAGQQPAKLAKMPTKKAAQTKPRTKRASRPKGNVPRKKKG